MRQNGWKQPVIKGFMCLKSLKIDEIGVMR